MFRAIQLDQSEDQSTRAAVAELSSESLAKNEVQVRGRQAGQASSTSHTLANACADTHEDGLVAACGLAQGMDFPATVAPFILRGVTLLGINSVTRPQSEREAAWTRFAREIDIDLLDTTTREVSLSGAIDAADELLAGSDSRPPGG